MAELKSVADPSMQILQFLLNAGGQKSTSTQTSSIDPAVAAQMSALLTQQMSQITPEGMQALIGAIFRQGAQQVPVLATQFAQSAGARTGNNSPLNIANQQLQQRLVDTAAQQLLAAQSQAGQTAARMADATRTTTTSQTTKAAKPGLAALPFLVGQLPNLKKAVNGVSNLITGDTDTGFGTVTGGSGGFGQVVNNPSMYIAPSSEGVDPSLFAGSDTMFDVGSLFDGAAMSSDQVLSGLDSVLGTAAENGLSAFDFLGFADGGLVRHPRSSDERESRAVESKEKKATKKGQPESEMAHFRPRGYADGGVVGARNTGTDALAPVSGTTAINSGGAVFGQPTINDGVQPPSAADPLQLGEDIISYFAQDPMGANSGWQASPGILQRGGVSYERTAQARQGGENNYDSDMQQGLSNTILQYRTGFDPSQGTVANSFAADTGKSTGKAMINPRGNDFDMLLSAALAAVGMATGNPALAFARSVGTRAVGSAAQGLANGGEVEGPGTGTSDSVPALLSDGEYVIPKDVVDAMSPEFFDMLKDMFHTPTSMQRFHAAGTPRAQQN